MSLRLSMQVKAAQWRNIRFTFLILNCLFHDCHISPQSKKEPLVLHSYHTEINIQLATFCLFMVLQHLCMMGMHKNSNALLRRDRRATFLHCSHPSVLRKGKFESQQEVLLSMYVKAWQGRDPLKNGKVVFANKYFRCADEHREHLALLSPRQWVLQGHGERAPGMQASETLATATHSKRIPHFKLFFHRSGSLKH